LKIREYLDYYKKYKIIPTIDANDINIKKYYQQRFNFYFKLGIALSDLRGKNFLEFCAGTGLNALFLKKIAKVNKITCVDSNSASLEAMRRNLKNFKKDTIIVEKNLNFMKTKKKYDFVMMENALPTFRNADQVFTKISKFLKRGGTLIITLTDQFGVFSEKLRYLLSVLICEEQNIKGYSNRLTYLTKVFKSHFKILGAHTRKVSKWTQDVILHDNYIKFNKWFSFERAFNLLKKNNLMIKSVSPQFAEDYIWYKHMTVHGHNKNFLDQYEMKMINAIDFETQFNLTVENNKYLINLVRRINQLISNLDFDKKKK
jgi:ubiquinone/menaquinone biosynthesis C-methylase UbiE